MNIRKKINQIKKLGKSFRLVSEPSFRGNDGQLVEPQDYGMTKKIFNVEQVCIMLHSRSILPGTVFCNESGDQFTVRETKDRKLDLIQNEVL